MKSNDARLGIIHKILGDILGLHVKDPQELAQIDYTRGFFLGNHVVRHLTDYDVITCICLFRITITVVIAD